MEQAPASLGYFSDTRDGVCLRPLLSLYDVELDFVAFLQALVSVELNCAVMHKHVGTVISPDKAVTLRVVEPLDFAFVLSHELATFLDAIRA